MFRALYIFDVFPAGVGFFWVFFPGKKEGGFFESEEIVLILLVMILIIASIELLHPTLWKRLL